MTPGRFILALVIVLGVLPPAVFLLTRTQVDSSAGGARACPVAFAWPSSPLQSLPDGPVRAMPLWQQYLAVGTGFVVKPAYMALSLVPIWLLRRRKSADLVALRWCCFFFFAGEAFCAINYLAFAERSYLMEYLHSFGMALAFAAGAYAILELADLRVVHFSSSRGCRLGGLCGGCVQHTCAEHSVSICGVRRIVRLGLPLLMLAAAIPLTSPLRLDSYLTEILGTRYLYIHEWPYQQYEIRFLPMAAVALFGTAWVTAGRERHPLVFTRLLIAGGIGAMGFSFFRWALLAAFSNDQIWFAAWEELTELAAVLAVLALLHTFRFETSAD